MVGSTGHADCGDRRDFARRIARRRDISARGVRRPHRRDRRRTTPAVRPSAALEGTVARRLGARPTRAAQAGCRRSRPRLAPRRAGGRAPHRGARGRVARRRARRVRRIGDRDGCFAAPAREPTESRRPVHVANTRRRTRVARAARRSTEGGRHRCRVHRRRDRGDVSRSTPRGHCARDVAAADGARTRARAGRGTGRDPPRSRRRSPHGRAGRRDRGRRGRAGSWRSPR